MGDPAGGLLLGHHRADLLLQFRMKARAPRDAGRQTDRLLDERAAQPLHVEDRRDMVGAVLHDHPLHCPLPACRGLQRLQPPHFQGADLPDAEGRLCGDPVHVPVGFIKREHAVDLRHFFVQGHFPEKKLRPLLRCKLCVMPAVQIHMFHSL